MYKKKLEEIRAKATAKAAEARQIAQKADTERRPLTPSERTAYDAAFKEADDFLQKAKKLRDEQHIHEQAKALADGIGGPINEDSNGSGAAMKSGGRLAASIRGRKSAGRQIAATMRSQSAEVSGGTKALVETGSVVTATEVETEARPLGHVPNSLLELLTVVPRSATYKTMVQRTRTNNAGVVPAGQTKPTSVFTVEGVDNHLRVFAHLSEPIDTYLLADAAGLERFVADEMLRSLYDSVETAVIAGDGTQIGTTSETNVTGLLNTSGTQSSAFVADRVTSIRAALTKLENAGHEPGVVVLNPTDWEAIETARSTSGSFDLGGPVDRAERKVWGVQVVTSASVPVGTGLTLDLDAVGLDHDGKVETRWSDGAAELFDANKIKARTEGRFGLSVFQPLGVVQATLTAA